jgi:hypothetical protein
MDEAAEASGRSESTVRHEHPETLALRKALDAASAEIARLERVVVDLERTELRTQSELAKAISDLEAARRSATDTEFERLRGELAATREQASRYRGALASMLESRSWKVTRPLRMARRSTRPERELLDEPEPQ